MLFARICLISSMDVSAISQEQCHHGEVTFPGRNYERSASVLQAFMRIYSNGRTFSDVIDVIDIDASAKHVFHHLVSVEANSFM